MTDLQDLNDQQRRFTAFSLDAVDRSRRARAEATYSFGLLLIRIAVFLLIAAMLAIAVESHAGESGDYLGLQAGRTHVNAFFDNARFAFPDLAGGGPGCCDQQAQSDESSPAFRFVLGRRFENNLGVELTAAWLGHASTSFDVSGPFGRALDRTDVSFGRCHEGGRFNFAAVTLAGTYSFDVGPVVLVPKLGLSANYLTQQTHSWCGFDFTDGTRTEVAVDRDEHRFSWSPMGGVGLVWPVTKDVALAFDTEIRRVTLSNNAESQTYGQGQPEVVSAWIGLQRRF